ncbi:MAG: hypothetical protein HYX68_09955 [Planctomycetes bacterium]|nr:hypothetical protein [Planctomycetota bacterium]
MKRVSASARWLGLGITCALLSANLPVSAGEFNVAPSKLEDVLKFESRVLPEDPFDPANRKDTKPSAKMKVRRGQVIRVELTGTPQEGWYTYPLNQKTPDTFALNRWKNEPVPGVFPLDPILETPALSYYDKDLKKTYFKYVSPFTWSQEILIAEDAAVGTLLMPIKLEVQVCKTSCYNFKHTVTFPIDVSDEAPLKAAPDVLSRILKKTPESPKVAPVSEATRAQGLITDSHEQYKTKMQELAKRIVGEKMNVAAEGDSDLLAFILAGIFWGAISLITPCVFPMIPITVSFFLKQSEKEHHRPIVMATVYSLTIVVVLTLAAAFLLSIFRWLSVHPITNCVIGGLFVFFALSLFGMYEIELPTSLARFTSAREGKGGLYGTMFMALTFTIISFACVAPFLGGFSGTAAGNRPLWHNLLGGLAFSVTFASPFFFLALFPVLLRQLPKSGSWLNTVKVVMGFLELAAAFKFFRTAELVWTNGVPSFLTFDFVLGLWIAMSLLCGLYLIAIYRLPHDTPEEHITVPRLLFSATFLGLALYLTPALFKTQTNQPQRPAGAVYAWIDSFLLPDSHAGEDSSTANLPYAIKIARDEFQRTGKPKRIFIDFTGVTCTNCKINEKNVFPKPQIAKLFTPYVIVKLYTDTVPAEYYASELHIELSSGERAKRDAVDVNLVFQKAVFDDERLPLYAILEPELNGQIKMVAVYREGRINDEAAFAEFLANPDKK